MNILILILIFLAIIIVSTFIICFNKLTLTFKVAITTIFLGIFCLILAFLPFGFFSKDITNNINSTLIGFGTGLILTAVTITFIQYFLDQQKIKIKEEIERKQEIDNLIKIDRIMTILINKYILYFNCVTTPLSKRTNNNSLKLILDFEFKDMQDLFFPSLCIFNYPTKPSIELFYGYEIRLRNLMIDIVEKNTLKYHEKILKIFINFITLSLECDFSDSIIPSSKNKKINSIITKLIKDSNEEYIEKLKNSKQANLIHPYIFLYDLLKEEGKLIIEYQNEIKKIKNLEEGS